MRLLVTGDRRYCDHDTIFFSLYELEPTNLAHGNCSGADIIAEMISEYLPYKPCVHKYPADWKRFRLAAGPIRNAYMLDHFKPDLVVAFHKQFGKSRGTKDMVRRALRAGVGVLIIQGNKTWPDLK